MATGANIKELEWKWFAEKLAGAGNSNDLNQLKRQYFTKIVGERGTVEGLVELEKRWLRSLTGVTATEYSDMWRQAVAGASLTPVDDINANKILYYQNV